MKGKTGIFAAFSMFCLTLMSLACGAIGFPEPYPPTPQPVVIDQQIQAAQTEAAQSGILSLTISEPLLTSWLVSKLNASPNSLLINNVEVLLSEGEITVYGKVRQDNLEARVWIGLAAKIDTDGKPVFTVIYANSSPRTGFEGLMKDISAFSIEVFTDMFGKATSRFHIESITIDDMAIKLTGRAK